MGDADDMERWSADTAAPSKKPEAKVPPPRVVDDAPVADDMECWAGDVSPSGADKSAGALQALAGRLQALVSAGRAEDERAVCEVIQALEKIPVTLQGLKASQ